jgi:hypothetical protein
MKDKSLEEYLLNLSLAVKGIQGTLIDLLHTLIELKMIADPEDRQELQKKD